MVDNHSTNIHTIDARSTNVTGENHDEAGAPLRCGDVVAESSGLFCVPERALKKANTRVRAPFTFAPFSVRPAALPHLCVRRLKTQRRRFF